MGTAVSVHVRAGSPPSASAIVAEAPRGSRAARHFGSADRAGAQRAPAGWALGQLGRVRGAGRRNKFLPSRRLARYPERRTGDRVLVLGSDRSPWRVAGGSTARSSEESDFWPLSCFAAVSQLR